MMWVFDIQCMGLVIAGDAITGQLGIFIGSFSRCTTISGADLVCKHTRTKQNPTHNSQSSGFAMS